MHYFVHLFLLYKKGLACYNFFLSVFDSQYLLKWHCELLEVVEKFALVGIELQQFITTQQAMSRDACEQQRVAECEARKAEHMMREAEPKTEKKHKTYLLELARVKAEECGPPNQADIDVEPGFENSSVKRGPKLPYFD